jgi:hypothetical protein
LNEYFHLAYEKLGLSPEGHEIGTTRYIELPDEVFYSVCARRLNHVRQGLYARRDEPWEEIAALDGFMLFKDWLKLVKNKKSYPFGNEKDPDHHKRRDAIIEWRALRLDNTHHYTHNFNGWRQYVCDASPYFAEKLLVKELPVRIPYDNLLNAYIVAASQSGKTELLKLLAHSVIKRKKEALIFIEPAGDAARQIALWPECKDRLIYVDLSLDLARAPTVNPFEIYGIKAADTSPAALEVKTVVAQQILNAFQEVLGAGAGAELSKNMQTIIEHCLPVLLDYPGATLRDLLTFMDDTRNGRLLEFAETRHHYHDVVEFFRHSFGRKHYAVTKDAIQSKLESLFASGKFARLTCGPSTFMLEKAIEERKIIIFNLAEGSVGQREGSAVGRLIVALLQGIAVRRDKQDKRVPTRVIIDEFHNFTTRSMEEIITQAAKYRLYLTMAGQQIGQVTSKEIRDAILNVSVLIGGRNAPTFHGPVASMLGVPPEAVGELDRGEFMVHLSGVPPLPFRIHTHLLGDKHRMSNNEREQVKADQLRRYHRPVRAPTIAEAPVPEIIPPRRDQFVPNRPRDVAPSQHEPQIIPARRVRRRRSFKADKVEITEEEEGIF